MPYPGADFSSEPSLGTHISKEAIQRVHEQIFGNPFSSSNHSRPDCPSPRSRNPKCHLPCPEFTLKHGSSSLIFLNKNDARNKLSFYFAVDPLSRIVLRFHSYDFSLGVLPGDMVLSINDVDLQQLTIDEVNAKLSSEGPSDLKLVLLPSEDNIEWSVRSIHVDYSYLGSAITMFGGYGASHNHLYEELFARQDHNSNRICLREWIKYNGSLSGVSGLITELYIHLLRDITSDPKGLCSVGDLVLVSHRDGYSMGTVADVLPEDGYHVKLHPNNLFLTVTLDSISRANNRELDGMEDLMLLRHLNEVAVVFNLHVRILNALPYTYAGDFALLSFNPMRSLDIYNDAVKHLFLKCRHRLDMPPHIFSVPQTILYRMENALLARRSSVAVVGGIFPSDDGDPSFNRRSLVSTTSSVVTTIQVPTQAICLLGRSGSGKSVNTEHLIEYFLFHSPSNSALTARKVRAIMCLLDAFTCSRTLLNSNASRCLRLFTLEFVSESRDSSEIQLYPSNLFVDILLLDKFRVTRRPQGEPTFHIFYYFLAGLENDVRSEYMLEDLTSPNLFMTPLQRLEDQALARSRWKAVREAARVLGEAFEEAFVQGVCRLLAAIYHLGCAGAAPEQSGRPSTPSPARRFVNRSAAERASRLLGCNSVDRLTSEVFGSAPSVDISTAHTPNNLEFLGGFVANLYAIATNALRDLINKAMNPTSSSDMDLRAREGRVVIVDPPGLQTPEAGGRMSGGSLEDLLYNYTNECLLQFYRNCQCKTDEGGNIKATNIDFVDFLDKPSDNFLLSQCQNSGSARLSLSRKGDSPSRTSSVTLSQSDDESSIIWAPERSGDGSGGGSSSISSSSTGLLWLLDYACCTGDMKTFLRLIAQKYVDHKRIHTSRESRLLRRLHRSGAFSLNHWNATAVVQYHPSTWLSSCHYSNNPRPNIELLQRSQLPLLRDIGDSIDEGASASALSVSSSAGLVGTFIQDTKYVVDLLRSCFCGTTQAGRICAHGNIYWIHCLLPVASAGLWQVAATSGAASTDCARACVPNPHARFCVPLVRAQLHAISLSTDLIYLKSAFVHRLLQDASATHNLHIKTVDTPSHSLSDDLVTITEVLNQSNGENGCNTDTRRPHLEVPSFSTSTKTAFLCEASQAGSDTNLNNHTPNGTADTYNFVFNTSNNLPWEQILSLAPVDRGLIKQLRFQLEEMEESKELLLRKQRTLTADLEECQQQLNQEKRDKRAAELRCHTAQRQNSDLQNRVEELEEELEEVSRKQRRSVVTNSVSPGLNVYAGEVTQLMEERNAMREEIAHLQERLAAATTEKAGAADMELVYQKAKVHELEGRLELETSTKHRLQSTVERLRGHVEQLTGEREKLLVAVQTERQNSRHLTRSLREALENKERAERRLAEEEHRRFITSNEVSSCVQEQLKLQQELSQFLLRYKEEELRSAGMYGEHLIGKADGQRTGEDGPEEECTVKVIVEGVGGGGKVEHLTSHPTNGSQESERDATT